MRSLLAWLVLAAGLQPPPLPHLDARTYESREFGATRRVQIYIPPAGRPIAGLLICLWGQDYVGAIEAPQTLDALIRAGRVPPIAAIFLEGSDDRFQDIATTRRMADSIAREVLPWAKTALDSVDARHTIVAGYSASGLASAYAAFVHPDVIGNLLSQSGAHWRGFDGEGASEAEWIAKQHASVPPRATRFYLDVGGAETRAAGGTTISIKQANEHLRDVLTKRDTTWVRRGARRPARVRALAAVFGHGLVALTKDWK